mmetsp:Transcript_18645/g.43125  ORF Transcript_18645/g.43125 Transcript_18645/m.43125 type:complete len:213 (-) Transcript_18645:549-1187(-)
MTVRSNAWVAQSRTLSSEHGISSDPLRDRASSRSKARAVSVATASRGRSSSTGSDRSVLRADRVQPPPAGSSVVDRTAVVVGSPPRSSRTRSKIPGRAVGSSVVVASDADAAAAPFEEELPRQRRSEEGGGGLDLVVVVGTSCSSAHITSNSKSIEDDEPCAAEGAGILSARVVASGSDRPKRWRCAACFWWRWCSAAACFITCFESSAFRF